MRSAQLISMTPLAPAGADLVEALDFYTKSMGFEVTWQNETMAGVRRGGVTFNLIQNTNVEWAENSSFSIGVDDLDALYDEFRGIPALVGPLELKVWGRREFHMIVPSGVCLQFYQVTP